MQDFINIIHLSDLHFCFSDPTKRDASLLAISNILTQVKTLRAEGVIGANPVLVFTGDLIFNGGVMEDFDELKNQLLVPLTEILDISDERIILVPGNHDIDSKSIPKEEWIIGAKFDGNHNLDELYQELKTKLANFFRFADSNKYSSVTSVDPRIKSIDIDGFNFVIWNGLAGSYARSALDKNDSDRGHIFYSNTEVPLLKSCLTGNDIIITHHPLSWYYDSVGTKLEKLFSGKSVLLTGHLHDSNTKRIESKNGVLHKIAAGLNGKSASSDTSLSILWVSKGGAVRARLFEYSSKLSGFNNPSPGDDEVYPESARDFFDRVGCSFTVKAADELCQKAINRSDKLLRDSLAAIGNPEFYAPDLTTAVANATNEKSISVFEIVNSAKNYFISGDDVSGKTCLLSKICREGNSIEGPSIFIYLNYKNLKYVKDCFDRAVRKEVLEIDQNFSDLHYYLNNGLMTLVIDDFTGVESKKLTEFMSFLGANPYLRLIFSNSGSAFYSDAFQPETLSHLDMRYAKLDSVTANTMINIISDISPIKDRGEQMKLAGKVFKSIHHLQAPRTIFYAQNFVQLMVNDGGLEPLNRYLLVSNLLKNQLEQAWLSVFDEVRFDLEKVEAFIGRFVFELQNSGRVIFSEDFFFEIASIYKAEVGFDFDSVKYFKFIKAARLLGEYPDGYAFRIPSFEHYFIARHMHYDEDFCEESISPDNFMKYADAIEFYVAANPSSKRISEKVFDILDKVKEDYQDFFEELTALKPTLLNVTRGSGTKQENEVTEKLGKYDEETVAEELSAEYSQNHDKRSDSEKLNASSMDRFVTAFLMCSSVVGVARLLKVKPKEDLLMRLEDSIEIAMLTCLVTGAILANGEPVMLGNTKIIAPLEDLGVDREDHAYILMKGFAGNFLKRFGFRSGSVELFDTARKLIDEPKVDNDIFNAALYAQNFDADLAKSVTGLEYIPKNIDSILIQELVVDNFIDQAKLTPLKSAVQNSAVSKLSTVLADHKDTKIRNSPQIKSQIAGRINLGQLVSETKGIGVKPKK